MIKFKLKILILLIALVLNQITFYGQETMFMTELDDTINESSGLIYLEQKLVTHNDSGGEPALYEIDSLTGQINRKVTISNAQNTDWEDICYDDQYIYIGDIGNNDGSRTDLKIYRLFISDYLNTAIDTVTADVIGYSYTGQVDFTPSPFQTNYDAEAIISYNDSLYIFTKNWLDLKTNIYAVPKIPGTYEVSRIDSINSQGLITGADYDSIGNSLILTGYTITPFVIKITQINSARFSSGIIEMIPIQPQNSIQIEAVSHINEFQYYLTAEDHTSGSASLYKLSFDPYLIIKDKKEEIFTSVIPNPFSSKTDIQYELQKDERVIITIYNELGQKVYHIAKYQKKGKQNLTWKADNFPEGVYSLRLMVGQRTYTEKLVKVK